MRVLFFARHATYFRNFESVVRNLADRGHAVHLVVERTDAAGGSALIEQLVARHPTVTHGTAPARERDQWSSLAGKLRLAMDVLRYLAPEYDGAVRLRERAAARAPLFAARWAGQSIVRWAPVRRLLAAALRRAERAIPGSAKIETYLRDQRPDLLVVTPLIGVVGSPQPDYIRAARTLGIPTALAVWSWDHLTSKALIRDAPDRVLVWNDVQKDEAVRLHGVPSSSVVVTGAQCFDHWFDRAPSRTRDAFCRTVGLPADRPYVLYVGSALFGGSPSEAAFVLRWIERLRHSADPVVRSAGILVRPHPQRMHEWDGLDLSGLHDVAVWGGNPVTDQTRADYFDSLAHSAAVVGLNTSAFIEAGIARRPVLAIIPDEFSDNQEGTLHFRYLTDVAGGLLQTSRTLEAHEAQLGDALRRPDVPDRHAAFLRAFVRPHGLDHAAAPVFVAALETMQASRAGAPVRRPGVLGRWLLAGCARLARSPRYRHWFADEEDRHAEAWRQEKARERAAQRRANLDPEARVEAERTMRARRTTQ
jgi:hypothetical protein